MWILALKIWLWIGVLASVGGWLLSGIHQLNLAGYLIFFVAAAVLLWLSRRQLFSSPPSRLRLRPRFGRRVPLAFLILTSLVLLGGILYAPTNHTGLSYRLP